jgi:hypothetical protein
VKACQLGIGIGRNLPGSDRNARKGSGSDEVQFIHNIRINLPRSITGYAMARPSQNHATFFT